MNNHLLAGYCDTCPFAAPLQGQLECRFNPPQANLIPRRTNLGEQGLQNMTVFPIVTAKTWCGQHPMRRSAHYLEVATEPTGG